jgi:hypothetical protein
MLIWGGTDQSGPLFTGRIYDPVADLWTSLSITNAPLSRERHATVWADGEMMIFNGLFLTQELGALPDENKRYSPPRTYFFFRKP